MDRSLWQDLAYTVRGLRRAPGFTAAVVLTVALGIGANTAVFSLLHALLFQPRDARPPSELIRVYTSTGGAPRDERDLFGGSSFADSCIAAAVGGVLGWAAVHALRSLLFEGGGLAPLIAGVAGVLTLVTLGACAIPAARAMAGSPASALRAE